MFETELPVFAGAQTAFRRAVRSRRRAAGPLAAGKLRGMTAVVLWLDPNSVEQRRMRSHHEIMRACGGEVQDLTAGKSVRPRLPLTFLPRLIVAKARLARSGLTMGMQDIITTKLIAAFAPESLHVEDESHLHEGHAGHRPGGETHFRLYIVARAFRGKTRLERHRMINAALASELRSRVHALAIHAAAPEEGG